MKIRKILMTAFASLLLFQISCNRDQDEEITQPKGAYENGYLISNEGNFGVPNASISFISKDLNTIENNIYTANNNGAPLGDVLQTIGFSGDDAYFVLNNSNKITVANRYTMSKKTEFTEQLVSPRYVAFAKSFVYVTNDAYGGEKYVSIYNLNGNSFVKKIPMTDAAERIVEVGGNIFVQNASFGFGNKITYIDTNSNTLKSETTIPNGQINKMIAVDSNLFVIAAGTADSYIYQISSAGNITKTTTLTGIFNANNLEIFENKYYFTSGNKIYAMDLTATAVPSVPLITVPDNSYSTLYSFSVKDGKIFTSDAKGFTEASSINVYSTNGALLKTLNAGRATNGYFLN